ncbi:MAG: ATP-binding cassette domain-containing protein [Defluviitaleaceae bacterium]|nr:ATP-binding cassette domain-containing protein [Defluviitaleaceae bacterium]
MIQAINISKQYKNKKIVFEPNIEINKGNLYIITGESGAGKTTLLNILGLLEPPTMGDIIIENIKNPKKREIMFFRRNKISYLFQNYALVENETVEYNLKIALAYKKNIDKKKEISNVLSYIDMQNIEKSKIYELSGGEQQKISLARAILKDGDYIFADEPTGNLDNKNGKIIFDILKDQSKNNKAVIVVTHDTEMIKYGDVHFKI